MTECGNGGRVTALEERMRKIDQLGVGSTVIFTRKPVGSWLTEGVPYLVEANGGRTAHFRNPATGGGTYDEAWAIQGAEFAVWKAGRCSSADTVRG